MTCTETKIPSGYCQRQVNDEGDCFTALAAGWMYDRFGPRSLAALPLLAAGVPVLAFTDSVPLAVTGALVWGAALGIQESTLRATVADLVPPARRATAYGIFAAVIGVATLIGGTIAGALYDVLITALVIVTAVVQAAALVLLVRAARQGSPAGPAAPPGPP